MRTIVEPLRTLGKIEDVRCDRGQLCISGWVLGPTGTAIDSFEVWVGGRVYAPCDVQLGMVSADVQEQFPHRSDAATARFSVRVPFESGVPLRDMLVALTPRCAGRDGFVLLQLVEPLLPVPPDELLAVVGGGRVNVLGLEFLRYFIQLAGLEPTDRVLEPGCGVGRMAYGLAYYLMPPGGYEGFDIIARLVDWAAVMTRQRPVLRFRHVNVYNRFYHSEGRIQPADFRFPYPAASFDFVVLPSVFTHMLPMDVQHYLDEVRRVLVPGGRCLLTTFLINAEERALSAQGRGKLGPMQKCGGFYSNSVVEPEGAIAYEERRLLRWITRRGFSVRGTYYGAWCGRDVFLSSHDILVLERSSV